MTAPIITFIVPVYQSADYLPTCLNSILAQNISKEIIIIDDGSPDNGLQIALDYAKQYDFITVIHSRNEGLSAARNKGIRLAKGEFLFFVDSDDYLYGDFLPAICDVAHQAKADVIKLQRELFLDSDPSQIYRWKPVSKAVEANNAMLYEGYHFFINLTHTRWVPCVCWSIYRRDYLLQHQHFFPEGIKAEDQLFYTYLLTKDPTIRVLELPPFIYHYRSHRIGSITNAQNDADYINDLKQVILLLQQWRDNNDFPAKVKQGITYITEYLQYDIDTRIAHKQ